MSVDKASVFSNGYSKKADNLGKAWGCELLYLSRNGKMKLVAASQL